MYIIMNTLVICHCTNIICSTFSWWMSFIPPPPPPLLCFIVLLCVFVLLLMKCFSVSGFVIEGGVARCPYGSEKVIDSLKKALLENNFKFTSEVELLLVRYIMEQVMMMSILLTRSIGLMYAVLQSPLRGQQIFQYEEKAWGRGWGGGGGSWGGWVDQKTGMSSGEHYWTGLPIFSNIVDFGEEWSCVSVHKWIEFVNQKVALKNQWKIYRKIKTKM